MSHDFASANEHDKEYGEFHVSIKKKLTHETSFDFGMCAGDDVRNCSTKARIL